MIEKGVEDSTLPKDMFGPVHPHPTPPHPLNGNSTIWEDELQNMNQYLVTLEHQLPPPQKKKKKLTQKQNK